MNTRPTIRLAIKVLQINISSIFYFILSSYVPHLQDICSSKYFHTNQRLPLARDLKKTCLECGSYTIRLFSFPWFNQIQFYGASTDNRFWCKIVHLSKTHWSCSSTSSPQLLQAKLLKLLCSGQSRQVIPDDFSLHV